MSSTERVGEGTVGPLLDSAFGFFVWMAHLVAIYVAAALACGFGVVGARARGTFDLVGTLAIVTLVVAAIVIAHAIRRWRHLRGVNERRFRMVVTVGGDAIALVAILWQLLAIGMVPACI
jgi:hypothetical protein